MWRTHNQLKKADSFADKQRTQNQTMQFLKNKCLKICSAEKAEKDCISHHAPQDTYGAGSLACCYVNMHVLLSSTSKLLKGEQQKLAVGGGGGGGLSCCVTSGKR